MRKGCYNCTAHHCQEIKLAKGINSEVLCHFNDLPRAAWTKLDWLFLLDQQLAIEDYSRFVLFKGLFLVPRCRPFICTRGFLYLQQEQAVTNIPLCREGPAKAQHDQYNRSRSNEGEMRILKLPNEGEMRILKLPNAGTWLSSPVCMCASRVNLQYSAI